MAYSLHKLVLLFIISILSLRTTPITAQPQPPICNAIFITYTYGSGYPIPPTDPTHQAYRFQSTLTLLNNGIEELKSWRVFVGFQHNELLVSASNAVLADGTPLPANVSGGATISGFPVTDLKTAVETAGDFNQMFAQVNLVGTQFGAPNISLPDSITLANDGFSCTPSDQGNIFFCPKINVYIVYVSPCIVLFDFYST